MNKDFLQQSYMHWMDQWGKAVIDSNWLEAAYCWRLASGIFQDIEDMSDGPLSIEEHQWLYAKRRLRRQAKVVYEKLCPEATPEY